MKIFRRTPNGISPKVVVPAGSITTVNKQVHQKDLDGTMKDVSSKVKPWDSTRVVLVKPLQDAARNHGQVLLMKDTASKDETLMAVKRMPNRWMCMGPGDFDSRYPTASEKPWHDIGFVRHLGTLGFPYVCELYDVFRSDEDTYVATSFCAEGDLFGWCDLESVPPPGPAREEHMRPMVAQIFSAVRWLHDLGIAHRDLSLENILLSGEEADAKVKIIDFGMATLRQFVRNEIRGKNSYQAPELHESGEFDTFLTDGFAIGVTVFAMAVQDYPWTATKKGKCQLFEYVSSYGLRRFLAKRRLRKGSGEHLDDVFSPSLIDLLESLLHLDPKHRGCIGEAAFADEVKRKKRKDACDVQYLKEADAKLVPSPRPPGSPSVRRKR